MAASSDQGLEFEKQKSSSGTVRYPLKKLSIIFFFYHILSSYAIFRKEICLLNMFLLENVGNQKTSISLIVLV